MKRDIFKKIPIEAYVFIVFPLPLLAIILIFYPNLFSLDTLLFYAFYSNSYYAVIFLLLYVYFFMKLAFPIVKFLLLKDKDSKNALVELKKVFKEQLYFNLLLLSGNLFLAALLTMLPQVVNPQKIVWTSIKLINSDYAIFGRDLLFAMADIVNAIGSTAISHIVLISYTSLSLAITVFLMILFIFSKKLAKKFIMFFFLVNFIGLFCWYLMPVLNPMGMYVANNLKINPPDRISAELRNYKPDPVLSDYQKDLSSYYKKSDYLDVTAFPSMHAAYSVGIILYAFLLLRKSIFITLPWFILEMAGALYFGQHYAVDLFLGGAVAIIAYWLVDWLFILEKKYYIGSGSLFIIDTIQNDVKNFIRAVRNFN